MKRIGWGLGVLATLGIALAAAIAASCLPDNAYQRFQLLDGTIYGTLRWAYERIHFDPQTSRRRHRRSLAIATGLERSENRQRLSQLGKPVHVVNFSVIADGRNVEWAIVNELYKTKSPKVLVVAVDETPAPWGHLPSNTSLRRQLLPGLRSRSSTTIPMTSPICRIGSFSYSARGWFQAYSGSARISTLWLTLRPLPISPTAIDCQMVDGSRWTARCRAQL